MSDRKSNITPKRRINEFNDRSLIEKKIDGKSVVWCKSCNVVVCHFRKSSIGQHLECTTTYISILMERSPG